MYFFWPLAPPREMTHGHWNFTLKARVKRSRNRTCRTVQKLQKSLLQNLDVKANSNSRIVIHKYKFSKTCLCFFMTMIFCKSLSTQGHSGFWFFSVLCTRHKLPLNCSVETKYLFFYFSAHRVTYVLHGRQCFQGKLFIRHNRNGKGKIQMIDYLNKHFPPCRNCCKARTFKVLLDF